MLKKPRRCCQNLRLFNKAGGMIIPCGCDGSWRSLRTRRSSTESNMSPWNSSTLLIDGEPRTRLRYHTTWRCRVPRWEAPESGAVSD